MGCDIHGWIEVKHRGKYVAIKELPTRDRNYSRFAALASVRDYSGKGYRIPRGIPEDASDTVNYHVEKIGADGHSHSYLPLSEAALIFLETNGQSNDYERKYPEAAFFEFEYEETNIEDARLVFWFDN